ncbi:MAG: cytochrome C oxidase subunit IV family protein [Acidobacteria bacterium]|nr:cytochrome C oxidase subunit IV family protein [Acidobacteriota bacterium]
MAKSLSGTGYGLYWKTWGYLLALTLGMLVSEYLALPRSFLLSLLLAAMLIKAALIGANFMHLRFEKLGLVLAITVGILATGAVLFFLIAFDGVHVFRLASQ